MNFFMSTAVLPQRPSSSTAMSAISCGACSLLTTSTSGMTCGGAYQWQMIICGSSFSGTTSKMFMAEVFDAMMTSGATHAASCS